jgi:methyl-accepting chemotaxis protein
VVAEEVRNLAKRSADAAHQTSALIGDSAERIREGTQIAKEVQTSLNSIVTGSSEVCALIGAIATASSEQAQGITHINATMTQMQGITQHNAAAAEESSAAAEELDSCTRTVQTSVEELIALAQGSSATAN